MNLDRKKINFDELGARLKAYRVTQGLSADELAERAGLRGTSITRIEAGQKYSTLNQYWAIVKAEQISVPWFFYGEGKWNDERTDFMPETIIRERGAGIRRNEERIAAETGQYTGDPFEFVLAVEAFKKRNNKPFPTWTEIFELVLSLGYRKVEPQTIQPYNILRKNNDRPKSDKHPNGAVRKAAVVGS